jgi:hypothetical protein
MRDQNERKRIIEAYLEMVEIAHYRPAAPGDGMQGIDLTEEELADSARLSAEATQYADDFLNQEDSHFNIGVSDASTNRALVYTIEAARALCFPDTDLATTLLNMATKEAKEAGKR